MDNNASLQKWKELAFAAGLKNVYPVYIKTAHNSELWDEDGNRYIDFGAGIAVTNVGHNHPKINAAIKEQVDQFLHTCFMITPYEKGVQLAEQLNALAPIENAKSVFLSTGAEAVENAVKIARAYTGKPGIIAFKNAFHGRTNTCLGLTWMEHYKNGFEPFPSNIHHTPFPVEHYGITAQNSIASIETLLQKTNNIGAIIIEPIQGEGGFHIAPKEFLQELRALCDKYNVLLIVDEIQSGFARTGSLFAIDHYEIQPDMITMAKGIANGIPMAAVVGKAHVMDAAKSVGGTYGGNPLGCAAALAVLEIIENEKLSQRAVQIGEIASKLLNDLKNKLPETVGHVRHLGAMIAIEFFENGDPTRPLPELVKTIRNKAIQKGLLLLSCGPNANIIRLLPPLTIKEETLKEGLNILEDIIVSTSTAHASNQ
ncbi:MAG: 4-aminobutyrate--2-oxoglutarate transaminase [Crocinitomicaceae bacterium]|nr:4-aminobutyrate--2-oxoglutarate transaminase [Crocinitomicaceae bacterium]|tara:strand:- start:9331 stop:10611 length:1281 start_codon:yes stop_codon:yes gene_type:complete